MGDRYTMDIKCAYCGHKNKDVYYAPTCSCDTFTCDKCGKNNFIRDPDLPAKKVEEITYEDIENGFLAATNVSWSDKDVKRMCGQRLKEIKNVNKKVK